MRSTRILTFLALLLLPACDGQGEWLRSQAAATAYAAPLAMDTTVVTTRRVWSSPPVAELRIGIHSSTIMPNGTGLATLDWLTGDVGVLDLVGREFRRFRFNDQPYDTGTSLDPVVSPDGGQIAFLWFNNREPQPLLRVVDVATGESRTIMTGDPVVVNSIWPLAWTAAGDSVFASMYPHDSRSSAVDVLLVPAAGGTPRLVYTIPPGRSGRARPSISPDGRWLLYANELSRGQQTRSDIYIVDVRAGGARPLLEHPAVDQPVGWLPGTDVVLFSSDRAGTTDLWSVRVVDGRASGAPRLVRSGFFRSEAVGFGDGAFFYRVETGYKGQAVVNVDPRSGALVGAPSPPLEVFATAVPWTLAWSPDGHTLAAPTRERGDLDAISVYSMQTGESRQFWLEAGVVALVAEWAADGKALYLRASEGQRQIPTGPHHYLRLDLVTGTATRLFSESEPEEPRPLWRFLVTPDDRSIVLRQQRSLGQGRTETKLVLRSLEDGSERELHRTSSFIPEFSLSTDGTQLAFMQQVWGGTDTLFILNMDGSRPLRALASWDYDAVTLLGWLPGGTALLAARLTENGTVEEILRIELDGSATVVGISPFVPQRGARVQGYNRSRLNLAPAGNRIVHWVSNIGEELWRMNGLHELFSNDASGRR